MDRKTKVVLAVNNMAIGGAQRLIVDQLRYFNYNAFDFYLITFFEDKKRKDFFNNLPTNLPIFRLDFKGFFDFKNWRKLVAILREIRPDVVRSSLFFSNTLIRLLKPFFRYAVIIAEHNLHVDKNIIHIAIDKILSMFTYKIVTDSKLIVDFTVKQERLNPSKFQVIYNGIDFEELQDLQSKHEHFNLKKELGFAADDKIILNIARLVKQKNHSLLIKAFAEFVKHNFNYKLAIVGDGALDLELKEQARALGLEDRVYFFAGTKDLFKFYLVSDFFVLTSIREGFCLTALMALAYGLPVISTKVAGPDEYIKDNYNGFLVNNDESAIAVKIVTLASLNKEERLRYRDNCMQTAVNYDIKKNTDGYERLFLAASRH